MWDLIVSVPDHCLSFYLPYQMCALSKHFSSQMKKICPKDVLNSGFCISKGDNLKSVTMNSNKIVDLIQ